jgi:hypothetical protein
MEKLPTEIRLHVARKATSELWKIDELLEVIEREVAARESSKLSPMENFGQNLKFRQQTRYSLVITSHVVSIAIPNITQHHAWIFLKQRIARKYCERRVVVSFV